MQMAAVAAASAAADAGAGAGAGSGTKRNAKAEINAPPKRRKKAPPTEEEVKAKQAAKFKARLDKKRTKSQVSHLFGRVFYERHSYRAPTLLRVVGYTAKKVQVSALQDGEAKYDHYSATFDPKDLSALTDEDELEGFEGGDLLTVRTLDDGEVMLVRKDEHLFEVVKPMQWTWVEY